MKRIEELHKITSAPEFWEREDSQFFLQELKRLETEQENFKKLEQNCDDTGALIELGKEAEDNSLTGEIAEYLKNIEKQIADWELARMLSGDDDARNAILEIHPGAGGTESQDWAQMLMRMYQRYAERRDWKLELLDYQAGDVAGVKSVTMLVRGDFAFGYLKAESGVHRLVRISPFDSNSRRHTSFASVFVIPEIDDDIEIEIDMNEVRVDTYRASGAGGQHVNKTDSAVRLTHIPTNIVVQCQNQRSQTQNKATALKMLKARLYQKAKEEEIAKNKSLEEGKKKIEWGSQIRSYVFHPYSMVKDLRTNIETGNVQAVMDGDIDKFIKEFLLQL